VFGTADNRGACLSSFPLTLRSGREQLSQVAVAGERCPLTNKKISIVVNRASLLELQLTLGHPGDYCLIDSVTSTDL
jgi:hypothetical protein